MYYEYVVARVSLYFDPTVGVCTSTQVSKYKKVHTYVSTAFNRAARREVRGYTLSLWHGGVLYSCYGFKK
jgi:hypothetical protein